jgi:hypothetical protein
MHLQYHVAKYVKNTLINIINGIVCKMTRRQDPE